MAKDDVFIDGEGMAHLFRFENGHVDYRSRWVRNERFRLQEQARRSLFGRYRNRYTNDPSVAGKSMGTANTNIVWHGRKLLALKEDSLPMELDPETLETRGEWRYEGAVSAVSLTAHPKLDYHTNELLTFSYQARGDATTDIVFYIASEGGKIVHETRIIPIGPIGALHAAPAIRSWMGDSRGHWEGATLVVETTNFNDQTQLNNATVSDAARVVERFTRTGANTLEYRVTIEDPKTWTKPWTVQFPLKRDAEYRLYEYACHEGNYYMYNALTGARAEEKKTQ